MSGQKSKGTRGGARQVRLILTLDSILELPPDQLVAALIRMSCQLQLYARMEDQLDLAVAGMFRLIKEHEHIRAVTTALSFKMPRLAKAFLIEGLEAHQNTDDPYRAELLELGNALKPLMD